MTTVLAIDPSSHTGWALLTDGQLIKYGKLDFPCKDSSWPFGIRDWVKETAAGIFALIQSHKFDKLLIERPNSSRWRDSQNYLDWLAFELISLLLDGGYKESLCYVNTSDWRKAINLKLNAEQKKQNKMVSQAKKEGKMLKVNGKRKGRVTKKHLSVQWVNEKFGMKFKLKDNDICDSICVGMSAWLEK